MPSSVQQTFVGRENDRHKKRLQGGYSAELIIAGGQIFKITVSRFVNLSEEKINLMKENAIPRNTKHATKFEMTHFKGKFVKIVLNLTKKPFKFP